LEFCKKKTDRCIILFHGLEGSAQRHYMLGAAKIFNENGFDCCAVNHRDCLEKAIEFIILTIPEEQMMCK
jgi:predicted alpha/beta-fold hydrolase